MSVCLATVQECLGSKSPLGPYACIMAWHATQLALRVWSLCTDHTTGVKHCPNCILLCPHQQQEYYYFDSSMELVKGPSSKSIIHQSPWPKCGNVCQLDQQESEQGSRLPQYLAVRTTVWPIKKRLACRQLLSLPQHPTLHSLHRLEQQNDKMFDL